MSDSALFIAGPTASGKSAAALRLAEKLDGVIINADAMQVYQDLRIITARPSVAEEASRPHKLYGVLDGAAACSAGRWSQMATDEIAAANAKGKLAILVGGTGLYFKSLEDGLSPIPETPPEIRLAARERRQELGPAAFREEVIAHDPEMAHLPEGDGQRLMRAWEVFEATGIPLSAFQKMPRQPLISMKAVKAALLPPRELLYAQCDARAEAMLREGAIEEVKALLARRLDSNLPVMKTLGVPEIAAYLDGQQSKADALATLQQNTRRFAKRQMTWLRNQMADWPRYETARALVSAVFR